jgi:hypothetical protein
VARNKQIQIENAMGHDGSSRLWDFELLDPLVARVGNVNMSVAVERHPVRMNELAWFTT